MFGEAVIHAGFIPGDFDDHKNYEDRIRESKPVVCENFQVKHYKPYMDCFLNLDFGNKIVGLNAALLAYAPHDFCRWLECICLGFYESFFLIDEEGPLTMLKCDQIRDYKPYIRLTILSSDWRYFNEIQNECIWSDDVEKAYRKTEETQIIADYLIKKEDLIREFFRETDAYFKCLTRSDYCSIKAERRPAMPNVRKYLREIQK